MHLKICRIIEISDKNLILLEVYKDMYLYSSRQMNEIDRHNEQVLK